MIPDLNYEIIAQHYTTVIKSSPMFLSSSPVRDEALLVPEFRARVDHMITAVEAEFDFKIKRKETYRSNTLQKAYYTSGASKIKANGMHHFGCGWDLICLDKNGEAIDNGSAKEYREMRKVASNDFQIHLLPEWDAGHMQAVAVAEQNALRNYISNYRATEFKGFIIRYGSENHYVGNLKYALQKLGFFPADYQTHSDYFFGATTEESLMKFQMAHKLTVDGICGKQTILKLAELGYDIRN